MGGKDKDGVGNGREEQTARKGSPDATGLTSDSVTGSRREEGNVSMKTDMTMRMRKAIMAKTYRIPTVG